MRTTYEWDPAKADENVHKHGVNFEDAREALEDPNLIYLPDRFYDGELRHQAIGQTNGVLLLMVAHAVQDDHDEITVRIISARLAERWEAQLYREGSGR